MKFTRNMDIRCNTCGKQMNTMKRCTRCKNVMYCSRDCQVEDWPTHQSECGQQKGVTELAKKHKVDYNKNDNSIFSEDSVSREDGGTASVNHPPLVDFSKAKSDNAETPVSSIKKPDGKCYLFVNEYYTDVPVVNESESTSSITVKCNKDKHKLVIQCTWTGVEIYKFFAYALTISLEKVKVIHKGKVLTRETICDTLKDKAVYQVIGETLESEEAVDQRDISVLMKQMGLERKAAVQVLKRKGDLIDALLDQ